MLKQKLYNHQIWSILLRADFDFESQTAILYLDDHNCVDMYGAIKFCKKIMPNVNVIETFAGNVMDTCYVLKGKDWTYVIPPKIKIGE